MIDNKNKLIDEMAKAERLEYFRNWRANNKDKVRESNRKYWQKRAEKRLQEEAEQIICENGKERNDG